MKDKLRTGEMFILNKCTNLILIVDSFLLIICNKYNANTTVSDLFDIDDEKITDESLLNVKPKLFQHGLIE